MKHFAADLHIHTALSPCAADEMTPGAIVHAARDAGLDMIAICDHNTAGNAQAVQQAARDDLAVIAGIEITTAEEVHVIGLFPNADAAGDVGASVGQTLPIAAENPERFGRQLLMDPEGRVLGTEAKMLSVASGFALSDAVRLIRQHGGLAVASHIGRPAFSVLSQLGTLPKNTRFDAIEISATGLRAGRQAEFAALGLPMVASSDSHFLADVGCRRTILDSLLATFDELALAFKGVGSRRCRLA